MESTQAIPNKTESPTEIIKEEINLQYHWYLLSFFIIYFGSLLIPAVIFMGYIILFYSPFFLGTVNFISLFTDLKPLLVSIFMPFIIIICYLIHLVIMALLTRWLWGITEKKSPSKSGIIPRNIPSKTLNFYHLRSFMIKYPKNAVNRGPFPWLIRWLYNFIGTNRIGKNTVIEENIGADRFVEIGNNTYWGVKGLISSHLVDGIFGNISFVKVKVGNNVTSAGFNCLGPGSEAKDNSWLLPMTGGPKYNILKGNGYYLGTPLRKIFKKKVMEYLQISEEDLKRAEALSITRNRKEKGDNSE